MTPDGGQRFPGDAAWLALGLLAIVGSLVVWPLPREALDWQPSLALSQPWRAWTAAFVHLSPLHLAANLAGAVVLIAFGRIARTGSRGAVAWLVAWPLTQLGLLLQPALAHYAGLSGVLHAGVAIVATGLQFDGARGQRVVGLLVLLGLAAKVMVEAPWRQVLIRREGWDIAIAPLAHATGAVAGFACALALFGYARMRRTSAVVE